MGWDPIFKVKHNLDTSSTEALARDLEQKLHCRAILYLDDYTKNLAEKLDIDTTTYLNFDHILTCDQFTMFITDDLFIPRSLVAIYGEKARDILANLPDEQGMINELKKVEGGSIRYTIEYGCIGDVNKDEIWNICGETLSGSPNFPGRWSLFHFLFNKEEPYHNQLWSDFVECRKQLYDYLQPIIKELPVYYHADQGDMERLDYIDHAEELEQTIKKYSLKIFNISDYILNPKSAICDAPYGTVFVDDFKDISTFTKPS